MVRGCASMHGPEVNVKPCPVPGKHAIAACMLICKRVIPARSARRVTWPFFSIFLVDKAEIIMSLFDF